MLRSTSSKSRRSWQQQLSVSTKNSRRLSANTGSDGNNTHEERRVSGLGGLGFSPMDVLFRRESNTSSGEGGEGDRKGSGGLHERRRSIQIPHPHVSPLPTLGMLGSVASAAHFHPGGHAGSAVSTAIGILSRVPGMTS